MVLKKDNYEMSESIILAIVLAIGGGFRDSYSFNSRGHVFANAQTGNLVLFSQALFRRNWHIAFKFVFPLVAFVVGVYITDLIKAKCKNNQYIHWRQIILVLEVVMLILVGFLPEKNNHFANVIISMACSMQVESFRNFLGLPMATTMCTGNMRSMSELLSSYTLEGNKMKLKKASYYYLVIFMFCIGAGLGAITSDLWGIKAIWLDSIIMLMAFFMMFKKK